MVYCEAEELFFVFMYRESQLSALQLEAKPWMNC